MASTFSNDEKRFVLAEIIKASNVDLERLVFFIKSHDIEPDWLNMRLPEGRTTNQCMEAARGLSIPSASLKRKFSPSQDEYVVKRPATMASKDRTLYASGPHSHLAHPSQPHASPQLPKIDSHAHTRVEPAPKKRGRPSRADKAKRDLRPMLPLAPRPTLQVPSLQEPSGERTTPVPAMSPTPSVLTVSSQSAYRASRGSIDSQQGQVTGPTPAGEATVDGTRPRILADGFAEEFTRDGRPFLPSPFRDAQRPRNASYSAISDRGLLSPKTSPSNVERRTQLPHEPLSRSAP